MKQYVANVKNKDTKETIVLRQEYNTKKEFREDIRRNGYSLKYNYIFTAEEYEDFSNGVGEITEYIKNKVNNACWNSKTQAKIKKLKKESNSNVTITEVPQQAEQIEDKGAVKMITKIDMMNYIRKYAKETLEIIKGNEKDFNKFTKEHYKCEYSNSSEYTLYCATCKDYKILSLSKEGVREMEKALEEKLKLAKEFFKTLTPTVQEEEKKEVYTMEECFKDLENLM